MMDALTLVMTNALWILGAMVALWLLSLALKNASIVDVFWGLGFVAVAWVTYFRVDSGPHGLLLCWLTTLWGVRLALHIGVRAAGKPEDVRYQALRAKYPPFWWKSFFVVFALQGALLSVASLPLQLGQLGAWTAPHGIGVLDVLGLLIFFAGFVFEAVADLQLVLFKRDPKNRGVVMDRGLWRYSAHPNYFGELVLWWGLGLLALSATDLAALGFVSLLGPALISFLLLRVSGVPMLEESMKKRRPDYAAYLARTSTFFPRRPRS